MENYYSSYYIKECNKLNLEDLLQKDHWYKSYYSTEINIFVTESFQNSKLSSFVYYNTNNLTDQILNYHKVKYGTNIELALIENLENGIKRTFYINNKISMYSIDIYIEENILKLRQEFNANFELTEYCESIYNSEGKLINEKYFFADSWTIHLEKIQ